MSLDNVAISVNNLSKTFRLPHEKQSSLKGVFLSAFRPKGYELQKALNDVSFDIKEGEFFGIVGRNGSGKSTLLKLMAGVYAPSKGHIKVKGKLVPFIELGVGFNPELTGRENVYLNGALLGINRKKMDVLYDDIVEFAELERFMDQKLNNYSSGMQVRLAFSIAIRAEGDILLLDEVLAVGDTIFQQKCFNYFHQLKKNNKTVILVSHDQNALRQFCTSGILIEGGQLVSRGPIDKIIDNYVDIVSQKEQSNTTQQRTYKSNHHGTGKVVIEHIKLLNSKAVKKNVFTEANEKITVEITCKATQRVQTPIYGITIRDASGSKLFGSNNLWTSQRSNDLNKGDTQTVRWVLPNIFNTGEYYISPAVADYTGRETYDSVEDKIAFKIRKKNNSTALINPEHVIVIDNKR